MSPSEREGIARAFTTDGDATTATEVGIAPSAVATDATDAVRGAQDGVVASPDAVQSSVDAFGATDVALNATQAEENEQDDAESTADACIASEGGTEAAEGGSSDGGAFAPPSPGFREKTTIAIPSGLGFRIGIIAACERRTRAAVIDEAFRLFLAAGEREPRPYLPDPGESPAVRITATVSSSYVSAMKERASSEARTYPALAARAIYDYAAASPFDTDPGDAAPEGAEGGGLLW